MSEGFGYREAPSARGGDVVRRHWRSVLRPVLVLAAYLVGYLALDFATEGLKGSLNASLWFPPAGLSFALLLVFGWRYAPAVALSILLHLILFREGLSYPPWLLLAVPVVGAIPYVGATVLLVRSLKIDPRLARMRDVAWFVGVACLLAPLLTAAVGTAGYALAGLVSPGDFVTNMLGFWAGEATGIGVLAPFLLVALRPSVSLWVHPAREPAASVGFRPPSRRELPEAGLQVLALAFSLVAAYGSARGVSLDYASIAFAPLVWIALRNGFERTTVAVLLINIGVVLLLSGTAEDANPVLLQFGLMALTLVGLLLGGQTTDRRRNQETVRASERRFRSVVQNSSEAIAIVDPDGTLRYASPAFERLFGYEPEEIVGENINDYIHPEDLPHVGEEAEKALGEPGVARNVAEHRLRHKDGTWRHVEAAGTYLLDDPAVRGVVVNVRDITQRKEAEEALKESEARFRTIFEGSPIGMTLADPDRGLVETNLAYQEMVGYGQEELSGKNLADFTHPEDVEEDVAAQREVVRGEGDRRQREKRYIRKDGEVVWARATFSAVRDEARELQATIGAVEDITERKEAEDKLRKSEGSLAEAQRMANLGSWEWDVKTGELSWSDEVFRIYGYEPEEFVPSLGKLTELVHPDDRELVDRARDAALYEREPYDLEHRMVRPDGEERVVHRRAEVVLDEEGEPLRMVGTVHDITERKRAEEALRESEERFRSAFEDAPIGVALVGLEGSRLKVNQALCEMLGYSEEELLGEDYSEAIHPEDREISEDRLRRTLDGELRSYTLERRYMHADGRVVWNLSSVSLIRDARGEPSHLVCLHQDITERKELEEKLEHQAFHDSLTELPNRALFLDRLGHALARGRREDDSVAVLFVDLDDFKAINDSLGHDAGNEVLVEVARRLQSCVRPGDTVGRIFGDEFAILLEAPADVKEARRVVERIGERLQAPFDVDEQEQTSVRSSIGVVSGAAARDDPEGVLRRADLAMYAAKSSGKSRYEVYDPSMNRRAAERLKLERALRRVVEQEELGVYYQPIMEIGTGEIWGFEALARWRHPEWGRISPAEFVPVAEKIGLVVPMGLWVMREACRQAEKWQEEQYRSRGSRLAISVNLSAEQFQDPGLAEEVTGVLRETGLDAHDLTLEITESAAMDDAQATLSTLEKLKGLGVMIAIDDFGTGYSSLSYLKRFPVDYLKIDRSFVDGLGGEAEDGSIVSTIIGLAQTLGLKVVAEGVETEEQLAKVKELGCEMAQGYYFAKPLPSEAASKLLGKDAL